MLRNIYFLKYFTLNKSHAVRIFLGYENSYRFIKCVTYPHIPSGAPWLEPILIEGCGIRQGPYPHLVCVCLKLHKAVKKQALSKSQTATINSLISALHGCEKN